MKIRRLETGGSAALNVLLTGNDSSVRHCNWIGDRNLNGRNVEDEQADSPFTSLRDELSTFTLYVPIDVNVSYQQIHVIAHIICDHPV
jgi:hypothetical protein